MPKPAMPGRVFAQMRAMGHDRHPSTEVLREHAFGLIWDKSTAQQALQDLRDDLSAPQPGDPPRTAADQISFRLLLSLLDWRISGVFIQPFKSLLEARMQFWDTEFFCPLTDYQTAFLKATHQAFPNAKNFANVLNIFEAIPQNSPLMLEDRTNDFQIVMTPDAKTTIFAFSDLRNNCLGIGWPTFYRAAAAPAGANLVIFKDLNRQLYCGGIRNFGDKSKTLAALRTLMADPAFSNTEIVFLGASGGTFGALFLAGTLGVKRVIGLSGPSCLELGVLNEDKGIYNRIMELVDAGALEYEDPTVRLNEGGVNRVDYFVAGFHEFDMQNAHNLLEKTQCTTAHIYPHSEHSITHLCLEDGRLIAAIRGESLEPLALPH